MREKPAASGRVGASVSPPLLNYVQELFLCSIRLPIPSWGSSPHTRGKRPRLSGFGLPLRLIPTHAGKTSSSSCITELSPAHPHSRGDKLVHHGHNGFRARLIPTHAGKTRSAAARMTSGRVHPRSYGENNTALSFMEEDVGSSPLTRGNTIIGHTSAENPGSSPLTPGKRNSAHRRD